MLVSTKGRYALRVMLEIAQNDKDKYMRLDEIADSLELSEKYLEGIVSRLSKAGLLESVRGRGGGYRLTREPEKYCVGEILRVCEDTIAPVACLECKPNKCKRATDCKTLPMWENLETLINNYLDSVTLADLLGASENKDYRI